MKKELEIGVAKIDLKPTIHSGKTTVLQLKSELQSHYSKSQNRTSAFSEGYPKINLNVTQKVGGFNTPNNLTISNGKLANIGENRINPIPEGRKLINYSNYTLNPENIINQSKYGSNKFYSNFLKE